VTIPFGTKYRISEAINPLNTLIIDGELIIETTDADLSL